MVDFGVVLGVVLGVIDVVWTTSSKGFSVVEVWTAPPGKVTNLGFTVVVAPSYGSKRLRNWTFVSGAVD